MFTDGVEREVAKLWLPIAGTLIVGVSLGLPLFLYLRDVAEERRKRTGREGGELH